MNEQDKSPYFDRHPAYPRPPRYKPSFREKIKHTQASANAKGFAPVTLPEEPKWRPDERG